jgi:glyoxylase-like metal-dependent hydrolase (beta-lactamase superfamily II)
MRTIRETDNLYRLTRLGMINCFLVKEEDGLTLVDTGLAGSADDILQAAKNLGSAIQRIAITHAHIDHIGSLDALVAALPKVELSIGTRESRLLVRNFALQANESGKRLVGFPGASSQPDRLLEDGDRVGSLRAISAPGHTPGHMALLDIRDGSLIAGDAFTTQTGLVLAGVLKVFFPFPALFSWNAESALQSGMKLRALNPASLSVGHGITLFSPLKEMDRALEEGRQQRAKSLRS